MESVLPSSTKKYFWGDNLSELSWETHRSYITQTFLEKGDTEAISWLLKQATREKLRKSLLNFKLSPKSRNFWEIYFS